MTARNGPQVKTCLRSSWLNALRDLSLLKIRGRFSLHVAGDIGNNPAPHQLTRCYIGTNKALSKSKTTYLEQNPWRLYFNNHFSAKLQHHYW